MAFEFVSSVVEQNFAVALKHLERAITSLKESSTVDKQALAQLYLNKGFCNQKLQLYRKALKDYEESLALARSPLALFRKGQVLVALNKTDDAKDAWNEALQAAGTKTDMQLLLDLSLALKDPQLAKAGFSFLPPQPLQQPAVKASANGNGVSSPPTTASSSPQATTSHTTTPPVQPASKPTAPSTPTINPVAPANGNTSSSSAASSGTAPSPSSSSTRQAQSGASTSGRASSSSSAAAASGKAGTKEAASSGSLPSAAGDGVEELDCAARQQAVASSSSRAAAGAGGGKAGAAPEVTPQNLASMLNTSMAIQLAVTQINSGQVQEAEAILDKVLAGAPRELGALVARGTARALRRNLAGAVEDFGAAIEVEPRYADSWKRRGQARSAMGDNEGALSDLQRAIDLAPLFAGAADSGASRAECHVERGMIYQKMRDYRRACREMQQAVKLDPMNHQAWNVLGLCSTSQGDIRDGVRAYERAVEINPKLREAWINMGQALKEEGRTKEAERVFERAMALDPPGQPAVTILRILGQMYQQLGQHATAIGMLDKAIAQGKEEQMVDLLYLRAICYHALGYTREAVRDYEACLTFVPRNASAAPATEESRSFQFLSFYQKDLALYTRKNLDRPVGNFCPDSELPPLFKEQWCKKGPPSAELIASYVPQPQLPLSPPPPPAPLDWSVVRQLVAVADELGRLLQNHHQGFLPNVRQQRAAGCAALELAQKVQELVAAKKAGRQVWVKSEGSSGQAGSAGRHLFGWRDAMDMVVKWRQLAEPNDQVVWVDLLTRREFEQGFGSHTPMFSGQTKCVRYYMNFARALELHKEVLIREGHAFDAQNRTIGVGSADQQDAIRAATTSEDLYMVIKQDSWVVVPIHSVSRRDHMMEGTRLTLVRVPNQPDAYEHSIRTPVTPPRWKDFDAELEAAWEGIMAALVEGDPAKVADAILTYGYYWYNFMPLARGTAAVGYTTILGLFWAAGMPVTATIPKDYQVDWEAILAQHPRQFQDSLRPWLYPPQAGGSAASQASSQQQQQPRPIFPPASALPPVADVLDTMRKRLEMLNGEGAKRI